jgi:hypothetical protein
VIALDVSSGAAVAVSRRTRVSCTRQIGPGTCSSRLSWRWSSAPMDPGDRDPKASDHSSIHHGRILPWSDVRPSPAIATAKAQLAPDIERDRDPGFLAGVRANSMPQVPREQDKATGSWLYFDFPIGDFERRGGR